VRRSGGGLWEAENAKLKRLLADAMLDNAALKDRVAGAQAFEGVPQDGAAPICRV
jgi:hypothetical protein